jgi:hypothetical protein
MAEARFHYNVEKKAQPVDDKKVFYNRGENAKA